MDSIAKASVRDLARRLRVAGDEHWDIRCILHHKVDIGWGDFSEAYGHSLGMSSFRVSNESSFWQLFYYSQRDLPRDWHRPKRTPDLCRTEEQDERQQLFRFRREVLFKDAYWLARGIGLSRIPGLDGVDISSLYGSEYVWLWLLFHASWSCPVGTVLRANKFIPVGILTRIIQREKSENALGISAETTNSLSGYVSTRQAVVQRNREMGKEERLQEFDEAAYEAEQRAIQLLNDGSYVSELPMDPFTASAALLELMVSDETPRLGSEPAIEQPSVVLNGYDGPVFLLGVEKPPLTEAQYNVIQCLLEAGENGVNKDELVLKSGHSDARGIISRLAKDENWNKALSRPGKTGRRYRIRTNPH